MYINVAYLDNMLESYLTPVDYEDKTVPLKVLCCGFYRITEADSVVETARPNGRKDYQLLYFHSGRGHFSFDGEDAGRERCPVTVTSGQFVLFRPGDRQVYEYYSSDHTEVYWIHFTGNAVEGILEQFGFSGKEQIYWGGVSLEYQNLFRKMIKELQAVAGKTMRRSLPVSFRNCWHWLVGTDTILMWLEVLWNPSSMKLLFILMKTMQSPSM